MVVSLAVLLLSTAACTGDDAAAQLEASLLTSEDLPSGWEEDDADLATALGGGFCSLEDTVSTAAPAERASVTLLRGETVLRQSLFAHAPGEATATRDAVEQRLRACDEDEESQRLGLVVEELPSWDTDVTRFRLRIDVADLPLSLDLAIWQQDDVLGVLRLTYPDGTFRDPLASHRTVTTTAQNKRTQVMARG